MSNHQIVRLSKNPASSSLSPKQAFETVVSLLRKGPDGVPTLVL